MVAVQGWPLAVVGSGRSQLAAVGGATEAAALPEAESGGAALLSSLPAKAFPFPAMAYQKPTDLSIHQSAVVIG